MTTEQRAAGAGDPGTDQASVADLPTGTVTFLFTDIEGSTRLLQALGDAYPAVLERHRELIEGAAQAQGGRVFGTEGDAVFIAFGDAASAVAAAVDAQRALAAQAWPEGNPVKVRMGIHTGDIATVGGNYVGLPLHQVARISAAANGGQTLLSGATHALLGGRSPRGILLSDLGAHRLRDLTEPERLFQVDDPTLPGALPPPRTLDRRPNNLPVQLTSFIGREEMDEAKRLLATTHLLTLTGPGGTGKTRLALQVAADVMEDYPDGVYFVPLEMITDVELVPSAITAAIPDLESGSSPPLDRLLTWVRNLKVLLVLDNFEQVVDGAPLVSRLLREAPQLKILATSRIPLHAYGEQEFGVPALGVPEMTDASLEAVTRSEAARLFVERAMAVQPAFRLTEENAPVLAEIVRRLDGLPLAIELAAARIRLLSLENLRQRLDQRLSLLVGGASDRTDRQRTLRGAIDWSYDLLDQPDRRIFERFAVFAGGAWLADAERCCGPADEVGRDVFEGVGSLTDKSLLRTVPMPLPAAEEPRFAMLATIREYAHEKLESGAEDEALHRRHAEAYTVLAEALEPELTGQHSRDRLDRLELDHDNLRAAIDWALEQGEAEIALRLGAALWRFWQIRGHITEATERLALILAMPRVGGAPATLRARGLGAAGSLAYWRADIATSHGYYASALEAARESGDDRTLADALYNFAFAASAEAPDAMQSAADGRPYIAEALELYGRLGDERGQASSRWGIAIADIVNEDFEGARAELQLSLEGNRRIGDAFGVGWSLHMLALIAILKDELDDAEALMTEALQLFAKTDDRSGITLLLVDFAMAARKRGATERQWRLAGASDVLRRITGVDLGGSRIEVLDWGIPERPTDDPAAQAAWDQGSRMTMEQAKDYALALDTKDASPLG